MNRILVKKLRAEGYLVDSCYDGESAYDYMVKLFELKELLARIRIITVTQEDMRK